MIIIVISKSNHREQPKTPFKYRIEHILNNVKVSRKSAPPGPQKRKPATKGVGFFAFSGSESVVYFHP